jgi:hypothetical protein
MVEGLWHRIIKAKYLSSLSVEHWLRTVSVGFWIIWIADLEIPSEINEHFASVDCLVSGFWNFDSYWERFDSWYGRINSFV